MKNRLRVLRAELAWSQADLAERLGVSRQTVNAIETGKYDPSLPLAFSLARTFKRRIEEIFEQIVELSGPSALVMGMANIGGQGLDLVRHFSNRSELKEVA